MRVNFKKVEVFSTKTGVCPACTRASNRSTTFFQTLSPFNTNADGSVKGANQIREELTVEAKAWKLEPVYHKRCE